MKPATKHHPADLPQLLEAACALSVEHHSHLVVCLNILPWMDMAVSADDEAAFSEACLDTARAQAQRRRRWKEVARFLHCANEMQSPHGGWCHAVFSFGLVRCWPVQLREQAFLAHGPFCSVVDGRLPWPRWWRAGLSGC
jgi:hypothetical protein